jgi:hypothetical protein
VLHHTTSGKAGANAAAPPPATSVATAALFVRPLCPLPSTTVAGADGGPAPELLESVEGRGAPPAPVWIAAVQSRAPRLAAAIRAALLVCESTEAAAAAAAAAAAEAKQAAAAAAANAAAAAAAAAAPPAGSKGAAAAAASKAAAAAASGGGAGKAQATAAGAKASTASSAATSAAAAAAATAVAAAAAASPGVCAATAAADAAAAAASAAAQLHAAVAQQLSGLRARLELVAARSGEQLAAVADGHAAAHGVMAEWLKARYAAECGAVAALDGAVRAAAAAGRPLTHDLRLEVGGLFCLPGFRRCVQVGNLAFVPDSLTHPPAQNLTRVTSSSSTNPTRSSRRPWSPPCRRLRRRPRRRAC